MIRELIATIAVVAGFLVATMLFEVDLALGIMVFFLITVGAVMLSHKLRGEKNERQTV